MKTPLLWMAISLAAGLSASTVGAQQCVSNNGCAAPGCSGQGRYAHGISAEDACIENSMWPKQYVTPSRRGICQAYETMVNNGWRRHNLLGKYHFNPETGELNEAGRLKVEWTLSQAPPHRRGLYVERGADQAQTADRLAAVQNFAASMSPAVADADVQETHIRDEGHPASGVDAVFTGFRANQLPPALPQAAASTTSSGQ